MLLQLFVFLLAFFYLDKTQAGTPSIDNCTGTIFRRVSSADATVSATWDEPNCGTNSHSTHLPGSEFGPGVHHIIYWFANSMDRSNTNERCCSFDVVVSGPDFDLCSQNVCKGGEVCVPEVDRYYCYPGGMNIKLRNCSKTVIIRKTGADSVTAQWVEPTAFDHYGQLLQPFEMPQFLPGSSLTLGEHAITYTFTDRGQEATCRFRVITAENTGPGFQNCPQDITVMSSESAVRVYWLEPMLQTNEDRSRVSFTQTHSPGQLFSVPSDTIVTYTFRDSGTSKSTECSFLVSTVEPESMTGQVEASPGNFFRILQSNPGQSPEAWPRPYYLRSSNAHTTPLIVIPSRIQADIRSGSTSNHIYPKGFYPVMYNFTDLDGNLLATSDFIIVYYNNDPDSAPKLRNCSGNTRIELVSEVPSTASWSVPYVEGNEENLVWTEKPQLRPNQDILPLGETVLNYSFYSPNDEEPLKCNYTVFITDRTPPQFLYCPRDITKTVRSETGLLVEFPLYLIAQDGSHGALSTVSPSQQPPVFIRTGQSEVITYTASDMHGNIATCILTVSVSLEVSFEPCGTQPIKPGDGDNGEFFSFTFESIVVIVVTAVATFVFSLAIFLLSLCCCTCCCVVDTAKTNTSNDSPSDDNQRTRLFVKIGGKNIPIYGPVTPLSTNTDVGAGRQIDDNDDDDDDDDDDYFDYDTDQPTSSRAYINEALKLPSLSESVFSNTLSNVATGNNYIEQSGGRENDPYVYDSALFRDSGFPPPRPPKLGKQENSSKMIRKKTFLEMQAAVQNIREEQPWKGRVVDDGIVYGFDQPAN